MTMPHKGGRYIRDPKTGALTRADESPVAASAAPETEIDAAETAPSKKGK
ncbi:hypothetical protein [Brucella anthropi]|nr:hypothetical protein [Brucella anthropi]